MRRFLALAFSPITAHKKAWLILNVIYFGMVILGALYTLIDPSIQSVLLGAVGESFSSGGTLGPLVGTYVSGALFQAIAFTFLVNLFLGSMIFLTLPSLVIPFFGLLLGVYRALLWGVLFAPFSGENGLGLGLLPHIGTIVIEGEAYVVALLGVWLWWRGVFGARGARLRAWTDGLILQARIYAAVAILLAVAAIYEVFEVIFIVPRLIGPG